jgi:hypothetical protein
VRSHKRWNPVFDENGDVDHFTKKDNQAVAMMDLTRHAKYCLELTATLIPDRRRGLWALLDYLGPREWGGYWDWAKQYCGAHQGTFGMDDTGATNTEELASRLDWVVDFVDNATLAAFLPEKRRQTVYLTRDQQDVPLEGWKSELKKAFKAGVDTVLEVQLSIAASRKRSFLLSEITEAVASGQKVLVFTGRKKDLAYLYERVCKIPGLCDGAAWALSGDMSGQDRFDACEAYMAHPGPAVLLGTYQSIGENVNLQDTDLMLVAMLPWEPYQLTQMEGRPCRPGQKRPVLIKYVVAVGTVDERVASTQLEKLADASRLTGDEEMKAIADSLAGLDDRDELLDALCAGWAAGEWMTAEDE